MMYSCVKLTRDQLCCLGFVNLAQTGVTWEEETLIKNLPLSDYPVSISVGTFS